MKKEERNPQKGITLVALVVTVIVLLILAGVTIMTVFGENGLISMAQNAKNEPESAQANTIAEIDSLINELNSVLIGNSNTGGTDTTPPIEVDVDGLGKVEVNVPDELNNRRPEITYDPDTGETGGVILPAEDVPETPVEIPEEKLPELIEFTYGKLESNSTYTPGTYETVPFEETYTRPKYPVSYQNFVRSQWNVTKDADGNITNVVPKDIELTNIDKKYSTYILYDFETEKYLEMEGVKGDSVELWTIYNGSDDTLDNIIYLAAYLKKTDGKTTRHIAKWDGSKYVAVDYDAQVNAVNTFTETGTISGTKKVEITAPSTSVDYVYVPVGTMKAEKGMTWAEWLASDYNTGNYTADMTVKDDNGNTIDKGTPINAGGKYVIDFPSKPVTTKDLTLGLNNQMRKANIGEYQNNFVSKLVSKNTASSTGASMDVDFGLDARLEGLKNCFEEIRSAVALDVENKEKTKDAVVEGTLQLSITYDNRITLSEEEKNNHLSIGNMYGFNDACKAAFKDIDRKILEGKIVQHDGSTVDMPGYNTLVITLRPCRTAGNEELYASEMTDDDRLRYMDLDRGYYTLFADINYYINGLNVSEASFDSAQCYTVSSTLTGKLMFKFPGMSVPDYDLNINYEQVEGEGNNYRGVETWQDVSATAILGITTTGGSGGGGNN